MLRFIKHHLTGIDGVAIYPILSLLIFFLFFAGVMYYVIKLSKQNVNDWSALPLESHNDNNTNILDLK